MRTIGRSIFVSLLAASFMAAMSGTSFPATDNVVIVAVSEDATSRSKAALKVRSDNDEAIDAGNAAVATASGCTGCRAVAVSVQVVLAGDHPTDIQPVNLAIAINENCTSCESLALAHQFILLTDGPFGLTDAGHEQVASVKERVRTVAASDATLFSIAEQVDTLMLELRAVLSDELVRRGGGNLKEMTRLDVES